MNGDCIRVWLSESHTVVRLRDGFIHVCLREGLFVTNDMLFTSGGPWVDSGCVAYTMCYIPCD